MAVTDRTEFAALLASLAPDNTGGEVSPADLRELLTALNESATALIEVIKTDDFSVTAADAGKMIVANKSTTITGALPAVGDSLEEHYRFRNIGVGSLVLDPNGSEQIEGAATLALATGDSAIVWPNAGKTAWRIAKTAAKPDPAPATAAASAKTTLAEGDSFPLVDSAASNALKQVTLPNLRNAIFPASPVEGDILVRGASGWARVAIGDPGGLLTVNGDGDGVEWAPPGWEAIAAGTGTFTNVTSLDITGLGDFDMLWLELDVRPVSDATIGMRFTRDGGSNWDAGASDYGRQHIIGAATTAASASENASAVGLSNGSSVESSGDNYGMVATIKLYRFNKSVRCRYLATVHYETAAGVLVAGVMGGRHNQNGPRDGIRIYGGSSTNITVVSRLFGIRG